MLKGLTHKATAGSGFFFCFIHLKVSIGDLHGTIRVETELFVFHIHHTECRKKSVLGFFFLLNAFVMNKAGLFVRATEMSKGVTQK